MDQDRSSGYRCPCTGTCSAGGGQLNSYGREWRVLQQVRGQSAIQRQPSLDRRMEPLEGSTHICRVGLAASASMSRNGTPPNYGGNPYSQNDAVSVPHEFVCRMSPANRRPRAAVFRHILRPLSSSHISNASPSSISSTVPSIGFIGLRARIRSYRSPLPDSEPRGDSRVVGLNWRPGPTPSPPSRLRCRSARHSPFAALTSRSTGALFRPGHAPVPARCASAPSMRRLSSDSSRRTGPPAAGALQPVNAS